MNTLKLTALSVLLLAAVPHSAFASKEAFVAAKCNNCHAISALGVEVKSAGDEEEEGGGTTPPDLSHAGKFHDAAFFEGYLSKKGDHVAHEGVTDTKKHKTKFKGTDEELKAMATWLASLK